LAQKSYVIRHNNPAEVLALTTEILIFHIIFSSHQLNQVVEDTRYFIIQHLSFSYSSTEL